MGWILVAKVSIISLKCLVAQIVCCLAWHAASILPSFLCDLVALCLGED